jgi:hypothetical protein
MAVTWTPPTVTDNCSVASFTTTAEPGTEFPVGTTTVVYTAVDNHGNTSTCSFDVVITDTKLPVFTGCPANIIISGATNCRATATWTPPTASDNCSVTTTSTHDPGDEFTAGTTTVVYTATDGGGNTATCSFTVTVQDTSPPVFSGCPANITVTPLLNCKALALWIPPTANDNCGTPDVTSTHAPGSEFSAGTTTVTYTATDDAGNTATCSFTVTVRDTSSPVFSKCPANITVSPSADCKAIANWTAPTASDNC